MNDTLTPYLVGSANRPPGPDTIQYKIGEIFGEARKKFQNGYMQRDALSLVDELKFGSQEQKHDLSDVYETRIMNMGKWTCSTCEVFRHSFGQTRDPEFIAEIARNWIAAGSAKTARRLIVADHPEMDHFKGRSASVSAQPIGAARWPGAV